MSLTFKKPLVVIDTETTGLDPYNRVIWDIALVRFEPDGTVKSDQFFIMLTQREIDRAEPEALEIGSFEERYNEYEALSKAAAARLIQELTRDTILGGIQIDFDVRTLYDFLRSQGVKPEWDYRILDIRALAVGYLMAKDFEVTWPFSQDTVGNLLGVDPIEEDLRHTAQGDAEYCAEIIRVIMENEED